MCSKIFLISNTWSAILWYLKFQTNESNFCRNDRSIGRTQSVYGLQSGQGLSWIDSLTASSRTCQMKYIFMTYDLDSAFDLAIPYILLFDKYPYWVGILRYDIWHYTIYVTKTPSTIRYQGPTVFSVFRIIIMVLFRVRFLLIVTSLLSGNIKHYGSCNPFCYKLISRSSSVKQ